MVYIFKFIILLLLFSCSTNEKINKVVQNNDKQLFEKGIQFLEEKKYKESIDQFIKISDEFPFSQYSSHSQIYNAYINFELNKTEQTILSFFETEFADKTTIIITHRIYSLLEFVVNLSSKDDICQLIFFPATI